jgi:hypothetical protein
MLLELSSTETYKSRDWRKMKKYKRHANQFKVWLQDPNFKIPLDVQFHSLNGNVSGKRLLQVFG